MRVKAAIFDVGGVLHSSEGKYVEEDITTTLGISREQFKEASEELVELLHLGKITEDEFWQKLIDATDAPKQLPNESLWGREFDRRYKVFDDVMRIVHSLKNQGIKVAICSNTIDTHAKINQKHGIYDPFEIRVLSHEVKLGKPDPRIYKLTLKKLKVPAAETIFIDDKKENVEGALAVGMHGIQFQDAKHLMNELRKFGVET